MLLFGLNDDGPVEVGDADEYEQLLETAEREADEFGSAGAVIMWRPDDIEWEWIPARWLNPPHPVSDDPYQPEIKEDER